MKSPRAATESPDSPAPYYPGDYRCQIFCCMFQRSPDARRSCGLNGSAGLRDYLIARVRELNLEHVRVHSAGCLDIYCEVGPMMMILPDGVRYRYASREDIDEILLSHVIRGKRVEKLLVTPKQKTVITWGNPKVTND